MNLNRLLFQPVSRITSSTDTDREELDGPGRTIELLEGRTIEVGYSETDEIEILNRSDYVKLMLTP